MNQARLAPLLARRVAPAASLVRPTLLSVPCRFAGLGRTNSGTTWAKLLKDTADHGPELLVLAMYFVLTCRYILIISYKILIIFNPHAVGILTFKLLLAILIKLH